MKNLYNVILILAYSLKTYVCINKRGTDSIGKNEY